ncbi:hypothetical protein [Streptomyces sp. NPDC002671]
MTRKRETSLSSLLKPPETPAHTRTRLLARAARTYGSGDPTVRTARRN